MSYILYRQFLVVIRDYSYKGWLPLDELPVNLDAAEVLVGQTREGGRGEINIVRTAAWAFVNYRSLDRFAFVCHVARSSVIGLGDAKGKVLTMNVDLLEAAVAIPIFRAVKSDDELVAIVSTTASTELNK